MAAASSFITRSSTVLTPNHAHLRLFAPRLPFPPNFRLLSTRALSVTSAFSGPIEVCVKESITVPGNLGDCPFSQRVLMTLEEKHLTYGLKLVDLANRPEWFLKVSPEGKVPVAKLDEKWISDSDIITQIIEEKFPEPPLATPPQKSSIKDSNDGTDKDLLSEIASFNDYLTENGPFVNGENISGIDLSLGPKLYHLEIALDHYKNWSVPESFTYVRNYMELIFSRESFVKTRALKEDVIAGWRSKVTA